MKKIVTKSEKETFKLGGELAAALKGGAVLALTGELGAGKTILTKGIAKGLGIKSIVNSPTFVLMKIYPVSRQAAHGIKRLVHLDCYRIKNPQEILDLGVAEWWSQPDTITIIEWGEKIKSVLPKKTIKISIKIKKNGREFLTPL